MLSIVTLSRLLNRNQFVHRSHWLLNSRNSMAPRSDKYVDKAVELVRCLPPMHVNMSQTVHRY